MLNTTTSEKLWHVTTSVISNSLFWSCSGSLLLEVHRWVCPVKTLMDLLRSRTCSGLGPAQVSPVVLKKSQKALWSCWWWFHCIRNEQKAAILSLFSSSPSQCFWSCKLCSHWLSLANDSLKFLLQRFLPGGRKRCSRNLKLLKESKNFWWMDENKLGPVQALLATPLYLHDRKSPFSERNRRAYRSD